MEKGLFITFEGLDGSGKTTQIKLLKEYLESNGYDVLTTIEPGGTELGKKIRDILLDKNNPDMSAKTETFLFQASRAELVSKVINPALKEGKIVLCDRFFDSTVVYQGIARNLGIEKTEDISLWATDGLVPDLTILLNVNVAKVEKRIKKTCKDRDRIELEENEFKSKLFEGYLKIAERNRDRFIVLDGDKDIKEIFNEIKKEVQKLLDLKDKNLKNKNLKDKNR